MLRAYEDPITDDNPTLPIDEKEIIAPAKIEDDTTIRLASLDVATHSNILTMGDAVVGRQTEIMFELGQEQLVLPVAERITLGSAKTSAVSSQHHIDLSPFQAWEQGVSRHHIEICRRDTFALISDLGSTNGTYLNGCRLQPHTERLLRNGDHLQLSKLSITVRF